MPPCAAQYPEQQAHSRIPMSVPDWRQPQGLRGRPGFKPTCRAEFATWTASGRAGRGAGGRRQGLAGLRDDAPSERSATKRRRCGGRRGACGAWPRCRRAAAGPGRASRRRAKRTISNQAPSVWRPPVGGGRPRGGRARRRPENPWCHKPRPKVRTPRSTPGSGRPDDRRGDRGR